MSEKMGNIWETETEWQRGQSEGDIERELQGDRARERDKERIQTNTKRHRYIERQIEIVAQRYIDWQRGTLSDREGHRETDKERYREKYINRKTQR